MCLAIVINSLPALNGSDTQIVYSLYTSTRKIIITKTIPFNKELATRSASAVLASVILILDRLSRKLSLH